MNKIKPLILMQGKEKERDFSTRNPKEEDMLQFMNASQGIFLRSYATEVRSLAILLTSVLKRKERGRNMHWLLKQRTNHRKGLENYSLITLPMVFKRRTTSSLLFQVLSLTIVRFGW